jgi:hypothetical protein
MTAVQAIQPERSMLGGWLGEGETDALSDALSDAERDADCEGL